MMTGLMLWQGLLPAVAQGGGRINTVALVPLETKADSQARSLAERIRDRIKSQANVLPVADARQMVAQGGPSAASAELSRMIAEMDGILDDYYAYKATAEQTLVRLEDTIRTLREKLPPSREASALLVTSLVTASWLKFKSSDRDAAGARLGEILNLSPKADFQFDYYPGDYRKFARDFIRTYRRTGDATLNLDSSPVAVNVYVNNIYVGVTPLMLTVPAGSYTVGWEAEGREPVRRPVTAVAGKTRGVSTRLRWTGGNGDGAKAFATDWNRASKSERLALAAKVAQATQADIAVILDIERVSGGLLPTARIYDARYSQMLKAITLPDPVSSLGELQGEVSEYLAKRIAPYVTGKDVSYWSRNVDRDVIVDHRVASRGKKPLYKRPLFWGVLGTAVAGGVVAGVLAATGGDSTPGTGGIVIGF